MIRMLARRWLWLPAMVAVLLGGVAPPAGSAPGASGSADWPQYRFAAHRRGFNPYETALNVSNASTLRVVWSYQTGAAIESSPAVVDGTVYIGSDDQYLYALDAATGGLRWRALTGGAVYGSPAVGNGLVYDTSGDNHLYAFDVATGDVAWSVDLGGFAATQTSPALAGSRVFATSGTQTVFAIDAQTGQTYWSKPLINLGCALDGGYSPAVWNRVLYQTGCSIPLIALNAGNGAFLWRSDLNPEPTTGPVLARRAAFYPTSAREMRAANASSGAVKWSSPGPATGIPLSYPALSPAGVVYQASYDQTGNPGYLTAWDARTGAFLWTATLPCGSTYSSPTIANGVVYVGYGGFGCPSGLAAFDATTGDTLLTKTLGGASFEMRSSPTVVNGMVYIGTDDGTVLGLGL
jgi:outer membrane protein assembly factor BamB